MTDAQTRFPPLPSKNTTDDEVYLFDYLLIIWRHRWMILALCVVAMGLTVVLSIRQPRQFESSVTVVPPLESLQKGFGGEGLGSLSSTLFRDAIGGLTTSIAGIYVEILESREVADSIIDRFQLMHVYEDVRYRADARRQLGKNTRITKSSDGPVKITVLDRDPNRSAAIANAYVEELDSRNKRLSAGQATSKRIFLENRLKEVEGKLSKIDSIPTRQAEVQEMLYELLMRELEMAKIEEARTMPTIQVLDPAVVPERGTGRGTVRKGMLAGVAGFMLGVFMAFVREYVMQARRRHDPIGTVARETQLPEAGTPPRKRVPPEMAPATEHRVGTG